MIYSLTNENLQIVHMSLIIKFNRNHKIISNFGVYWIQKTNKNL